MDRNRGVSQTLTLPRVPVALQNMGQEHCRYANPLGFAAWGT
jgi:hypothetical protein